MSATSISDISLVYFHIKHIFITKVHTMGYTYGHQIATQTLRFLADSNIPSKRLSNAFSEIGVLTVEDTTKEIFEQIVEWQDKYLSARLPELREQAIVTDPSLQKEIDELIDKLVWICIRVLETAAK